MTEGLRKAAVVDQRFTHGLLGLFHPALHFHIHNLFDQAIVGSGVAHFFQMLAQHFQRFRIGQLDLNFATASFQVARRSFGVLASVAETDRFFPLRKSVSWTLSPSFGAGPVFEIGPDGPATGRPVRRGHHSSADRLARPDYRVRQNQPPGRRPVRDPIARKRASEASSVATPSQATCFGFVVRVGIDDLNFKVSGGGRGVGPPVSAASYNDGALRVMAEAGCAKCESDSRAGEGAGGEQQRPMDRCLFHAGPVQ